MFSGLTEGRHQRGVTLMEAIIASSIVLMVTAALGFVLSASYAHHQRIDARLELNQQALTALSHLQRELAESNVVCVNVSDAQSAIFPSPRTETGDFANVSGSLGFPKMVCYRLDQDALVRQEELLSPVPNGPSNPLEMTPPRTRDHFLASNLPKRVMARGVVRFECERVTRNEDVTLEGRIRMVLGLSRQVRGRTYGIEVESSVLPLN